MKTWLSPITVGEDVHAAESFDLVVPQDFAGLQIQPSELGACLDEELAGAVEGADDGGGESATVHPAFVLERRPDFFSSALVQLHDGGTRLDIDMIAIDERGGDEGERGKRGAGAFGVIDADTGAEKWRVD